MSSGELPEISLALENRVIRVSVRVRPGRYDLSDVWRRGALVIDADDVVVDFQGAIMTPGGDVRGRLDQLEGYGIVVRNRRNVTIRNAGVHGYRFNIFVSGGENVRLENCDVSFSRGHRIWADDVPIDQWVVIRELNDWRTYGAGIWMEQMHAGVVRRCRACGAQNGVILADCRHCLVTENDLAFNSGWGIALWQSCDNIVSWNRADFCNRPWAGGLGADASGMVVAGGSHRNCIVGNSLSHGGDGFFLTDRSEGAFELEASRRQLQGPSNDNVIAHNDGSWSPANAFEGTFSCRNVYYRNIANHCAYGFWLGFSSDSLVLDNEICRNRHGGIAIEQGCGTRLECNRLEGNGGATIKLWAVRDNARDRFPSRDLEIRENRIKDARLALDLTNSTDYYVGENTLEGAHLPPECASTKAKEPISALSRFRAGAAHRRVEQILAERPADFRLYTASGGPCGWEWIEMDDFAPRDFRGQLAAYRRADAGAIELFIFDPQRTRIEAPDWVTLRPDPEDARRVRVEFPTAPSGVGEVRMLELTLRSGEREQVIRRALANCEWIIRRFDWSHGAPRGFDDGAGWEALFAGRPVLETRAREPGWSLQGGSPAAELPAHHLALAATTRVRLAAGRHRFCATFDDGLRLSVDGQEVYANWRRNRPQFADVERMLEAGEHVISLHYCYEDRYSVLRWYWGEGAG